MVTSILDRLSATLKTDIRYLLHGSFFLSLTQVTSALISLGLTIAYANLIPVETYGTYKYLLSTYGLLTIFALPGTDTAVLQSVSRGFDSSLERGFSAKLRFGTIGTLAAFGIALYHMANGSTILATLFAIAGLALPFMESAGVYISFLNGKKVFRVWALSDITTQIISAIAIVVTIFLTKNIYALALAYFIPAIILRFSFYIYFKNRFVTATDQDPELFSYGRSVTLFQIIARGIISVDQIILFHFMGPAQVAIFSLAQAMPTRIQSFFRVLGTIAFPKFAERSPEEIAKTLPRKLAFLGGIILLGCIAFIFVAPFLFKYLFPKYLNSLAYSQVLMFSSLAAVTYPLGSYLFAHKKIRESYIIIIANFLVKILCLLIFVPLVGIWGAVIGVLASASAAAVISFYVLYRDIRRA